MDKEMDLEYRYGLMALNIKDIGKIIKQTEKENLSIQMEIFIKDYGLMIEQMAREYIFIMMALNTKEIG